MLHTDNPMSDRLLDVEVGVDDISRVDASERVYEGLVLGSVCQFWDVFQAIEQLPSRHAYD